MGAFTYLILTKTKNKIKGLFKSPGKLIYTILFIALIIFVLISNIISGNKPSVDKLHDRKELVAGIFAVYALIFYLGSMNGFSTGASIFGLPDVNMLFVAPFNPRKILMYGLIQQLQTCLLMGVVIVFQYAWLNTVFAITIVDLLVIIIGYVFIIFIAQLISMLIYSVTNHNEIRRKIIKTVYYAPLVLFVVFYLYKLVLGGTFDFSILVEAGSGKAAMFFPIIGWITDISRGFLLHENTVMVGGIIASLVSTIVILVLLFTVEMDYYEDVLQTAEASYTSVVAAKEGRIQEAAPRKVKLGKTGLTKGFGASAFYYKHLIENRRGKLELISPMSLIFIIMGILFAFFMKDSSVITILAFTTYLQMFSSSMGRLPRELLKPYIYLVPEKSFAKLLYSLKESVPSYFIEAILLYIPVGLIIKLPVYEIIILILVRVTFSFLFIVGNLLVERVFGMVHSKALTLTFYFIVQILLVAPGIVCAIVLSALNVELLSGVFTGMLAMSVLNLIIAWIALFCCRNMLQYAELNQ